MQKIALIQIARFGDICSILPIAKHLHDAGNEVSMICSDDFIGILQAVSYVTPIRHRVQNHRDVAGAKAYAKELGFENIIACQVDGNPTPDAANCENFIRAQWNRAGFLEYFPDLPLVFDNRDKAAEARALKDHLPPGDKPLLVTCLNGHSSKFLQARDMKAWIDRTFADTHRILHLSDICLRAVHHLLAFIEAAEVLITIDTLPLHLAYATGTPTIAMSTFTNPAKTAPAVYWNSEPRSHWVYHCSYADSMGENARSRIQRIIDMKDYAPGRLVRDSSTFRPPPEDLSPELIRHVFHWFDSGKPDEQRRMGNAMKTWAQFSGDPKYVQCKHELKPGDRTSKDIGDAKAVPFIKDVIDFGCEGAEPDDIVVFTNTDICFAPETIKVVRAKMKGNGCCYSRRIDVFNGAIPLNAKQLGRYKPHVGADLFACRVSWWKKNRKAMPDLLISFEGFDWVMRRIFEEHRSDSEIVPACVYHEKHISHWSRSEIIKSSPAQLHNRKLCKKFALARGLQAAIYDESHPSMFKSDEEWRKEVAKA